MATCSDVLLRLQAARGLLRDAQGRDHQEASQGQSNALLAMLQNVHLSSQDVVKVAAEVSSVPWASESEKTALLGQVATAMQTASRAKQQNFEMICSYLTEQHWQTLLCDTVDFSVKLQTVAGHCQALGLRSPTEPTAAMVAALLMVCCEGPTKARCLQPQYARDVFLHTKASLKPHRTVPPHIETVPGLPADVAQFRETCPLTWKAVFSEAKPTTCKLPLPEIVAVSQHFHMRIRKSTSMSQIGLGNSDQSMLAISTAVTQAIKHVFGQGTGDIPITMLRTPCQGRLRTSMGRVADFAHSVGSRDQLAIYQPRDEQPKRAVENLTAGSADDELDGNVDDVAEMSPPPVTPPPKKKTKQTVEEAAAKILSCMSSKADVKACMKRPAAASKADVKACVKRPPTPKPKPAKTLAGASVGDARPCVSIEKSRSQVLYRSGLKGPGQSKVFKYTDAASKAKALRDAKKMAEVESKRRHL